MPKLRVKSLQDLQSLLQQEETPASAPGPIDQATPQDPERQSKKVQEKARRAYVRQFRESIDAGLEKLRAEDQAVIEAATAKTSRRMHQVSQVTARQFRDDELALRALNLLERGYAPVRVANALGLTSQQMDRILKASPRLNLSERYVLQTAESGGSISQIAAGLGVTENQAKMIYARAHVTHYGASPAVQHGLKQDERHRPFPAGIFEQPNFTRDTNKNNAAIGQLVDTLRGQLDPYGYQVETGFEPDPMGGRHVVKVVKDNQVIGQPFRLTATPNGVPLINKTGKSPGGYRLTLQGQGLPLKDRLGDAVLKMIGNHNARAAANAARASQPVDPDDDYTPDAPDWLNEGPPDDYAPEMPDWLNDAPPEFDTPAAAPSPAAALTGKAKGPQNVLDILDVTGRGEQKNKINWRSINAFDFMRQSQAGQFREENSETLVKDQYGNWAYPEGLAEGNYLPAAGGSNPLTPVVSKGTIYPLEARNYIAGNIRTEQGQWGSQKGMGKQMKRDELSLTRRYWQAGPALGVAYEPQPQHTLGQRADQPEMAYTARAFVLDQGGIIPEGQMWKDTSYAPWIFGSFEMNPEKYEIRFDERYSDQEVLQAAGLWNEKEGKFKPRMLRPGDKVSSPSGFKKDVIGNNEAGVISGYEIVDTLNESGVQVKALRLKGYFGNRPSVVSAMKLEGWKNLAQDKHLRQQLGIDADLVTNKPSDPVVAGISSLNALSRQELEDLWEEVHGHRNVIARTETMADLEAAAKVYQRLHEKNRATITLRGQRADADTLANWRKAGLIKDEKKIKTLPPLFEGAEPMYETDLRVSGSYVPVRTNFITDVTNLRRGRLSNEILRSIEHNFPGLGDHLRDLGYKGRDLYNTLFEMHQLNTKADSAEVGSPVVDVLGDIAGNPEMREQVKLLQQQRFGEILPEALMQKEMSGQELSREEQLSYDKFDREAGAYAFRQYYQDQLGTDSFIFKLGDRYMVNPELTERFGFVDEMDNLTISKLASQGNYHLGQIWKQRNRLLNGTPKQKQAMIDRLNKGMDALIPEQEALLQSTGARKKWFGTSDTSMATHVHASDYGLPRNSMALAWDDLFRMTGLKNTPANRKYLTRQSRAGQLLFSGIRNPASDPIAQTGTILNMLTPDLIKEARMDLPLTGHPVLFHPHHVQAQGGDNDSDESQIYMVMKRLAGGKLDNAFGLAPSDPAAITGRAQRHAAGEYADAVEKLMVTEAQARQNILGFDPSRPEVELKGRTIASQTWMEQSLEDYKLNSVQIGQAYNFPIRVGVNLADDPQAKALISEYGGWLYQNPLDKKNYEKGSPEADFFNFFTSFNAMTGSFQPSNNRVDGKTVYYNYRKEPGFEDPGQYGAAGLLAIMKRMTEERPEGAVGARMSPEQFAAFTGLSLDDWDMPALEQLTSKGMENLKLTPAQQETLKAFAEGDSAAARMMRGYGVRKGIKSAGQVQLKLEGMQDPARRADIDTTSFRSSLREQVNILQNKLYYYGKGPGSAEFKKDYETFNAAFGMPNNHNWFPLLDPGSKQKPPGQFYGWDEARRQKFYKYAGRLLQKHVTGLSWDETGKKLLTDPAVSRNHPLLSGWFEDYDRIRSTMAINAREGAGDEVEGWSPSLAELETSEVTGHLVREKYTRKQKDLAQLGQLYERFERAGAPGDFEDYLVTRLRYTPEEQGMFREAELGHREAWNLRRQRFLRGYDQDEPMYFAEGGKLTRPTRLGRTEDGRAVIGGEAGTEYVVPENKTQDLGGGLKLFDEDHLGPGAPSSSQPVMLAGGGKLDYWENPPDFGPLPWESPGDPTHKQNQYEYRSAGDPDFNQGTPSNEGVKRNVNAWTSEGAGGGNNGGGSGNNGDDSGNTSPSGKQPERAEMIGFTKALTGQYIEQLHTVVRGLQDPQMVQSVIQAANSGAMLPNLPAAEKEFVEAAAAIQTNYQRELARAQRVTQKFEMDREIGDIRGLLFKSSSHQIKLPAEEKKILYERLEELKTLKAEMAEIGMTQRIPETEYLYAKQAKDLLTSGPMGGHIQTTMISMAGEEAQGILKREGYEGSYLGHGGTRRVSDPDTLQAVQDAALIKARSQVAQPELAAALTAERQDFRLAQLGQKAGDIDSWYRAIDEGQQRAFGDPDSQQARDTAVELSGLSRQRQALFKQALPLKQSYHEALGRGDIKGAQRFYDQLAPLADEIGSLKDEIGSLTPYVKEHVEQLGYQTRAIKDDLQERKKTYSTLRQTADTYRQQAMGLPDAEKQAKIAAAEKIELEEIGPLQNQIKQQARLLGQKELEKQQLTDLMHEPQGRAITGLGKRPVTPGQQALGTITRGYDPQSLFWQFQNVQQMQYMAFMPMLQMRQQHLAEQYGLGQAQYALGAGGMPQSVLRAQMAQANMSRATSAFGRGVDRSMAMRAWQGFTDLLADNESTGSAIGSIGFDAVSGLTALMAGRMVAWPALKAGGQLVAPLARSASSGLATYLGGTAAGGAGLGAAMSGLAGLATVGGGLALGGGINQALARYAPGSGAQGLGAWGTVLSNRPGEFVASSMGYLAGYQGDKAGRGANPLNNPYLRALADRTGLADKMGWDLYDEQKAVGMEKTVAEYLGVQQDPIPVWITKIEGGVAEQLGLEKAPFDRAELAQMAQMYAENYGVSQDQLENDPRVLNKIIGQIASSYSSGVSMAQNLDIYQKAAGVSGYAPGTAGAASMADWVNQGSLFQRQQKLQAGAMVQETANLLDFSPEQRQQLSQQVYTQLSSGLSEEQVSRGLQQRGMTNAYTWSQAAYAAGQPENALMDEYEPWKPKYQDETWAIQRRRRQEDNRRNLGVQTTIIDATHAPARQRSAAAQAAAGVGQTVGSTWSGGRQEQELGFQRERFDLEEKFWNFRRQSQEQDFQMSQRMFDFQIRQMQYNLDREEKYARLSEGNWLRQYEIQKQIFDLQTDWQLDDFQKQEGRLNVQWAWQQQDMATSQERLTVQTGWQEEDFNRAIRYASGRERLDLRRQRERALTQAQWQQDDLDTQQGRAETQHRWDVEDLDEARQRFEELRPLQEEQMRLGYEYWQVQKEMGEEDRAARRAFAEEQIALMLEQNTLTVQQYEQSRMLEEEQHQLELRQQEAQMQWATQDLQLARERAAEDEIMAGWEQEISLAREKQAAYLAMGYDWTVKTVPELETMRAAAGGIADEFERAARAMAEIRSQQTPLVFTEAGQQAQTPLVAPQSELSANNSTQGVEQTNALLEAILQVLADQPQGTTLNLTDIIAAVMAGQFSNSYQVR